MAPDADASDGFRRTTRPCDDVFALGLTGGETR